MGLNKSKGNMYEFTTHTYNTIKGKCPHDCGYCLPAGTLVMKSDFTQIPIEEIMVGDEIIGITNNTGYSKFTKTKVINTSNHSESIITINTDKGTIKCTKNHPLLGSSPLRNCNDWRRAELYSCGDSIRYVSGLTKSNYSTEHRLGYIKGVRDGDGCVFHPIDRYGNIYSGFEMVCIDKQLSDHVKHEFMEVLGIKLKSGTKRKNQKLSYGSDCPMIHTRITNDVDKLEELTSFRLSYDFACGYIAGMIDTDGSVDLKGKSIRISQSKTVNRVKYNHILDCCQLLGLSVVEEKTGIRIISDFNTRMFILFNCGLYHSYKSDRLIIGSSIKGSTRAIVKSVKNGKETLVYNLQTECGSYIANGFIVHNCYMKRWGNLSDTHFDRKELKTDLGEGNFIFVGSSCDMFAEDIPNEWIIDTLNKCNSYDNKYLFQSKNPMRMARYLNDDWICNDIVVCTTLETNRWMPEIMHNSPNPRQRVDGMKMLSKFTRYVTIEPIIDFDLELFVDMIRECDPEQVNIGADSGNNGLPEPSAEKIAILIEELKKFTTIANKHNLSRIMGAAN